MKIMKKKLLVSICVISMSMLSFNVLAQENYLIDSLIANIRNKISDGWILNKHSDSVFMVEREKLIPIGNYQTRLALDSFKFKFIFVIQEIKANRNKCKKDFLNILTSIENKENLNYNIPPTLIYDNYSVVIFDNHPDIRGHLMDSTMETDTADTEGYFDTLIPRNKRNIDQEITYVYNQVIKSIAKPENIIDYIAFLNKYQRDDLVTETDILFFWGSLRELNYPNWREY